MMWSIATNRDGWPHIQGAVKRTRCMPLATVTESSGLRGLLHFGEGLKWWGAARRLLFARAPFILSEFGHNHWGAIYLFDPAAHASDLDAIFSPADNADCDEEAFRCGEEPEVSEWIKQSLPSALAHECEGVVFSFTSYTDLDGCTLEGDIEAAIEFESKRRRMYLEFIRS